MPTPAKKLYHQPKKAIVSTIPAKKIIMIPGKKAAMALTKIVASPEKADITLSKKDTTSAKAAAPHPTKKGEDGKNGKKEDSESEEQDSKDD